MPEDITQKLSAALRQGEAPPTVFSAVKGHLYKHLHDMYMSNFSKRCVLCYVYLSVHVVVWHVYIFIYVVSVGYPQILHEDILVFAHYMCTCVY